MSLASALVVGNDALPQLAEEAFRDALAKTGQRQANGVLLFLTADFIRQAQATVTAVARAARCTQIAGGVAAGLFTEQGWVLDRPAAAVMVFGGDLSLAPPEMPYASGETDSSTLLSCFGNSLPAEWGETPMRYGSSFSGRPGRSDWLTWQQARVVAHSGVRLVGGRLDIAVSRGWQVLADPQDIDETRAYDLLQVGGVKALTSLLRHLPPELRAADHLPLASLGAMTFPDRQIADRAAAQRAVVDGSAQPLAIISGNADLSLTLAERLSPGQRLVWAVRSPQTAVDDMRHSLAGLTIPEGEALGAVVFSCIGRGPYFYDGDDRDVDCLRERFPGLPLIGTYGTGQLAPGPPGRWRRVQNAVVTALIGKTPVDDDV
ncbi:MAG: FIST C-terminal domain-containing protein [Candidatus Accumulibacter sp.]|nr:FIST C-terminal domain-containing protein [Accumulibacter sp.]